MDYRHDREELKRLFVEKLQALQGRGLNEATPRDKFIALGGVIRDQIHRRWVNTRRDYKRHRVKQVYYFSMEFLLGRLLGSNLLNMGLWEEWKEALAELGIDLCELEEMEPDAGLGNGGLGRLAACFLDSLASQNLPAHGCGIRYRHGHFRQKIIDGYQVELPESWLREGNVWEIRRPEKAVNVRFGGRVNSFRVNGRLHFTHEDYEVVKAVPYDMPVIGYKNETVNTLRLWNAETEQEFDLSSFNRGDFHRAVQYRYETEAISEILYPDDTHHEGQVLRLKQEYFLASAGVQSIIRSFKQAGEDINELHEMVAIHINDTHPALVIPELMRILMDEEHLGWDEAWRITTNTVSFTNHTIMSEALEEWPEEIFKNLLPRIHMIVEEINERFCRRLWDWSDGNWDLIRDMAITAHGWIRMAPLAIVGSHSINGVARIHTEILKKQQFAHFYNFSPSKFNNKTNGITHRRWLLKANQPLAELITRTIGRSWIRHPEDLIGLVEYAADPSFREAVDQVKRKNKHRLANLIQEQTGIGIDVDSIFDVQIKRIHAYKRQLMNILHVLHLYNSLRENGDQDLQPWTFIFSGKAAPGYLQAKRIIKLINTVAELINGDPEVNDRLRVVFLENYRVSLAEELIPGAEISEQISTAGKEASGTGNMKMMMNGAVTLGTMDGANIEIRDEVGPENIINFGLAAQEALHLRESGGYSAQKIYNSDPRIKRVLDQLIDGSLPASREEFEDIYNALLYNNDEFFVLRDFSEYHDARKRAEQLYQKRDRWLKMAVINIAHSGKFSSDRTVADYASGIWEIEPFTKELEEVAPAKS